MYILNCAHMYTKNNYKIQKMYLIYNRSKLKIIVGY